MSTPRALCPTHERFLPKLPDIKAEIVVDYGLIDIVAKRFDTGVRTGSIIAKDMITVPIGPDIRMVVVGSPPAWGRRRHRNTTGLDDPLLYQSSPAGFMSGIREGWPRKPRSHGGTTHSQKHPHDAQCGVRRIWSGLSRRGSGAVYLQSGRVVQVLSE